MWHNKAVTTLLFFAGLLFAVPAQATPKFLICTTACTWDNTNDTIWSLSSGGANNTTHPTTADTVTLDAATCIGGTTCTITVAANIVFNTLTTGACTASTAGCILDFSANNNNVTVSGCSVSISGTGTRTVNLGGGTWTYSGCNGVTMFNAAVTTGLSFNANASTLIFNTSTAGSANFNAGGLTFSTISFGAQTGAWYQFVATGTIGTLNVSAPASVAFFAAGTVTITNALNFSGISLTSPINLASTAHSSTATINSANNGTFTFCTFLDLTFTGGGTFTATNSVNSGHNVGIAISAPSGGGGGKIIGG